AEDPGRAARHDRGRLLRGGTGPAQAGCRRTDRARPVGAARMTLTTIGPEGTSVPADTTVVSCGTMIDGTDADALSATTLVLEGERVAEVVAGPPSEALLASATAVIDASQQTVMPGMMDMHVHLIHGVTDPREPHILYGILSSTAQMLTLWGARNARLML